MSSAESRSVVRRFAWITLVPVCACVAAFRPPAAYAAGYTLVGWNNLGMHCMDADYSVSALLPPYNTILAQLIDPQGLLVRDASGIRVTYEAVADPDGSVNSTSQGKTNFWAHVQSLFGVSLGVDQGLAGHDMPGASNQPQPMAFDATASWFIAEGVPITPYDDAQRKNTYPLMHLVARDASGMVLATTDIVLPVSDEMDCGSCHASGSSPSAQPSAGWVNDPVPQRDTRLNILRLHDDREGASAAYQTALAAAGYDAAGLFATAAAGTSVLCARCHHSEALAGSGLPGVEPLTQAVHRRMAGVVDPATGMVLGASDNRSACYRCHPGAVTRCLRGAMGAAVAADGTLAIQCQNCHGSMLDVASPVRTGWLNEPTCQSCHTGTAISNNGQLRYTSAFDTPGQPRVAVDQTFATTPDAPAAGLSLYRFSTGHGGLKCEACHGSTHAEFPSTQRNDNLQSVALQGHAGVLAECDSCHGSQPLTVNGGPHGMHPVGQAWVDRHPDAVGEGGSDDGGGGGAAAAAACQSCHGADYRGTVLSRVQADRTVITEFGPKQFWRGFQVGCYTCHLGPGNSDGNPNQPPVASDAVLLTDAGTPAAVQLAASDPNGDGLTLRIVSQPGHGTVGLSGATAQYFPEAGYVGDDAFTYAAWDGSTDSNLATVRIAVRAASQCVGDCSGDGQVTINEVIMGVAIVLGRVPASACAAYHAPVTVTQLISAVNAVLRGCSGALTPAATATATATPTVPATATSTLSPPPTGTAAATSTGAPAPSVTSTASPTAVAATATPTTNPDATFANIQATIFSTTCADQYCHSAATQAGSMVLAAGMSYGQLVGVQSTNAAARAAGLLRVKPGDPDNSFLVIKLSGPPVSEGSPMPLGKPPLTAAQIQAIRDWIAAGALP